MAIVDASAAAGRTSPAVSVVLPTYNHLHYLPRAVASVLAQTYPDLELIIVDDGSTDGTSTYLNQLTDPRIRVLRQENQRLPRALNNGLAMARGGLVTWISADNYCAPYFVEALRGALAANPSAGFAYSAFAWIDENDTLCGVTRDQDLSPAGILAANPGLASFMYRRDCHDHLGWYDPELEGAEDWDMWLRITERCASVYVPEILYYYRSHATTMTARIPDKIRGSCQMAFDKALLRRKNVLQLTDLYPNLQPDDSSAVFIAFLDFGTRLLLSPFDATHTACQFLTKAVELSPDSLLALCNLAVAHTRLGNYNDALMISFKILKQDGKLEDFCRGIKEICLNKNAALAGRLPVITLPDDYTKRVRSLPAATYSLTLAPSC